MGGGQELPAAKARAAELRPSVRISDRMRGNWCLPRARRRAGWSLRSLISRNKTGSPPSSSTVRAGKSRRGQVRSE